MPMNLWKDWHGLPWAYQQLVKTIRSLKHAF